MRKEEKRKTFYLVAVLACESDQKSFGLLTTIGRYIYYDLKFMSMIFSNGKGDKVVPLRWS